MKGFIYIRPLGLPDDIIVGLAQIASVEPVQRKRRGAYYAELHLGDGRIVQAEELYETVLDAIEVATGEPKPIQSAEPLTAGPNGPPIDLMAATSTPTSALAVAMPQAEFKREAKRRGRPPKAKTE